MFRCQITGELSAPSEKPEIVVVEKRKKEYYGIRVRKRNGKELKSFYPAQAEKLGEGWEIVKSIEVRPSTLERLEKEGKTIECIWIY